MRNGGTTVWVAAAALSMALEPLLAAQPEADVRAAAKGKTSYVRYCVSCHGKEAKGDGPLASDLRVAVPDLTTLAARNEGKYPFDRVVRIIENGEALRGHGTADMPAWGDVFKKTKGTEEATVNAAIRSLSHYIWSLQPPAK